MPINEEKLLDEFKRWLRDQPLYVIEGSELMNEQIDDAPMDYILDFCYEKSYSEKTEEELLNWIALRNEVYIFLEERGIKRIEN